VTIHPIHSAVDQVRHALRRQIHAKPEEALTPEQLDGWCELAEAIEYHHLVDKGYPQKDLHSNQVAELGGNYRHAFLVVAGPQENQLVDPTFGQFLTKGPGQSLQTTEQGRKLLGQLLEEGHAPWNRQTATLYGQAMQISGDLYQEALQSERPMLYQPSIFKSLLI
jgi:hypothetical protein